MNSKFNPNTSLVRLLSLIGCVLWIGVITKNLIHTASPCPSFCCSLRPLDSTQTCSIKDAVSAKTTLNSACSPSKNTAQDTCPSGKETNIWYMGYSGLDWNQGRPDTISYFQYRVGEGHTSICDRDGNLLLYENGLELYNKNHFRMHWFWYGGSSVMTLLLPQPGNDSLYHLFQPETNDRTGKTEYLYHTVINVLANGGKGLIKGSQKDRKILAYSGERVTAARHCNGKDWWVIGQRATDEQYSVWLLTDQGLSAAPVWTGYSGVYHNDFGGKIGTYGHIKVSHDGSTLAEVTGSYYIEIHQFDPATGVISNGVEVMDRSTNQEDIYFCEFSSDNSKLYVSGGDAIYQMDLSNRNQDSIRNSKTVIYLRGTFGDENFLAPIIGPDEKIYFEGGTAIFGPYLAVVHKPNEKGVACQFERKGLKMPHFSNFGSILFPSGMQFPYKAYIYGPLHSCPDTVLRFRLTDACAHEATQWTVLDGAELRSHQGDTIDVYFGQPGVYRIAASYPARCGFRTDTAWVTVSPCACNIEFQWTRRDTIVCKGQDASMIFESNATDYSIRGQKTGDTIHLKNLQRDSCIDITLHYPKYCDSIVTVCVRVEETCIDTCPSGKETNIWYMGYSGLDWNQGRPDTISYFQASLGEGHTSICDRDGNLLLYENSTELYNKNHFRMHWFWYGGSSVMTLLLPQPGNDSLYHLFQPEANDLTGRVEYLYHTVINVLANGGKGLIKGSQRDRKILAYSGERVTAARHCNGKDWWVIGQSAKDEQYSVWLLTDQGLSAAPVWTGYSGVYHNDFGAVGTYGHIKVSHDGSTLAEVTSSYYLEIHQFDPATGVISNGVEVMDRSTNQEDIYWCEFSSDNSKLYVGGGDAVYQMDLSNRNQDSMRNSKTVIYTRGTFGVEEELAPIIGPDEKIYFEGGTAVFGPYLAVVHKPNEKGAACQFERKGLKMPHFSNFGSILFPSGMQFPYKAYIYGPLHSCPDTVLRFRLTDACAHEATQWTVLDGAELRSHQGDTIDVYFGQPGVYRIAASYPARCGFRTDTAWVTVSPCACDIEFQWTRLDTVVCKGQDASIIFESNATDFSIHGQKTGDTILLKNLQKDSCIDITLHYPKYCDSIVALCVRVEETCIDTCPSGKETNIWYMGYSGLDWNQGRPDTISYFQASLGEGHTSLCDRDGNLLLYENSSELYNKNHFRMHWFWYGSSSVMTLLLPQPGNDSLYHLFQPETNDRTGRIEYLYHTVINIIANGGKGLIKGSQRDRKILAYTGERVTAARHCNGKDWWVIGQSAKDEQYSVWLLTDQGLSAAPVWTGYSGVYHNDFGAVGTYGHIKVSHDGSTLAEVTSSYYLEIHQFDPATGVISNGVEVIDRSPNQEFIAFCEFSSDNSKLYVGGGDAVYQMDLSNRNQDSIRNSKTVIYTRGTFGVEEELAPIIGPDEKIYFEGGTAVFGPYLAVVHKPNEKGAACQFERKGLKMPHFSNFGSILFPSGMQFPYKAYIYGPLHSCPDTVLRFRLTDACAHEATQWTVLDGAELRSHQGDTIDVYFAQPGVYRIAASYPARCGFRTDTAWVTVSPCACNIEFQWTRRDTIVCKGQDASMIFESNATDFSIHGQKTGDTILLKNLQRDSCVDITLHYPKYCDSIVAVCVRVAPSWNTKTQHRLCAQDSVFVFDKWEKTSGVVSKLYQSVDGCDSLSTVEIKTSKKDSTLFYHKICRGDTVFAFGKKWTETARVSELLQNSLACPDSLVIHDIFVHELAAPTQQKYFYCYGDTAFYQNNAYIKNEILTEKFQDQNGCDSMHSIEFIFYPKVEFTQEMIYKCTEDSILINGIYYRDSISLYSVLKNNNGCDSTHTTIVKNFPRLSTIMPTHYICANDSIYLGGAWRKTTEDFIEILNGSNGCDSTIFYSVSVLPNIPLQRNNYSLCAEDSIWISNRWIKNADTIRENFITNQGCDSTILHQVHLIPSIPNTIVQYSICQGDSVSILGKYYFDSIQLVQHLSSALSACDSTIIHQVSLLPTPTRQIEFYICYGDSVIVEGVTINEERSWTLRKKSNSTTIDCDSIIEYAVYFYEDLYVDLPERIEITEGDSISLKADYSDHVNQFHWMSNEGLSCVDCPDPILKPKASGVYFLEVKDQNGCTARDSIQVIVIPNNDPDCYIPNSFSPNGDGINDEWLPVPASSAEIISLSIFSRWGELIYHTKNPCKSWDGNYNNTPQLPGVYVYTFTYKNSEDKVVEISGDVSLVR